MLTQWWKAMSRSEGDSRRGIKAAAAQLEQRGAPIGRVRICSAPRRDNDGNG